MAVSERSIEVEGVAFSVDSSHWSGSRSPPVLYVPSLLPVRERQGSDADDSALGGAAESVGVSEQYGLRRRDRLELRSPEASSNPKNGDGQHGEAEGSAQSEKAERDKCDCGKEEKDRGARGWRWNLGDGLAECEAEGSSEQRDTAVTNI